MQRPLREWIRLGYVVKKGLHFNPADEAVTVVYEARVTPDRKVVEPYETETPASAWESLCFYASNLRLQHFIVSGLLGLGIGFLSLLLGLGIIAAIINGALIAVLILYLQCRNPRSF